MRKIKSLALLAVAALVVGCSSGSKDVVLSIPFVVVCLHLWYKYRSQKVAIRSHLLFKQTTQLDCLCSSAFIKNGQ